MRQDQQRLHDLCYDGLKIKGLETDEQYVTRLKKELKELDAQGEWDYFLKLYDRFRAEKLIFPYNEQNNLVDYVLGLAPSVDITQPSAFVQGEAPDIDIDYLKPARDYLKRDWAARIFGQEKICEDGRQASKLAVIVDRKCRTDTRAWSAASVRSSHSVMHVPRGGRQADGRSGSCGPHRSLRSMSAKMIPSVTGMTIGHVNSKMMLP
jgi:hypothetical protein